MLRGRADLRIANRQSARSIVNVFALHDVRQIVYLTEQFSGGTAGVGNKDLTIWSRQIFDYLLLVDRLDTYSSQFGLAQPPQRPFGLIGASERGSDEIPLARLMNGNAEGTA